MNNQDLDDNESVFKYVCLPFLDYYKIYQYEDYFLDMQKTRYFWENCIDSPKDVKEKMK